MYSMLMVYLDPFADNTGLMKITVEMATRFKTGVLGVSACQLHGRGSNVSVVSGGVIDAGPEELEDALEATKQSLLTVLQPSGCELDWRPIVTRDRRESVVIRHARSADMVIVNANYPESIRQGMPYLNTGDLVMQAGRPLLIVPPTVEELPARNILVAWKDTREARRAVSDALPVLRFAERAIVVEIARKKDLAQAEESVGDVVRWLKAHGVNAEGKVEAERGRNALQLESMIKAQRSDLIVAGAYHHRRFRQWALGGVTHNLLLSGERCVLVSH